MKRTHEMMRKAAMLAAAAGLLLALAGATRPRTPP